MLDKSDNSGVRIVTALQLEMRRAIQVLGDNPWSRKQMYDRAARAAGISARMAKSLFLWEASVTGERQFSALTIERVRSALRNKLNEQEGKARDEYRAIVSRLAAIEARLQIDPEFYGPDADGTREQLRLARRQNRTLD